MKLFFFILLILSGNSSCLADSNGYKLKENYARTGELDEVDYLIDIQSKINSSFGVCFMQNQIDPLKDVTENLSILYETNKHDIVLYWLAYARYYECIFYMQTSNNEKCKSTVKQGIDCITKMSALNSDDLVILAQLQSLSLQFENQMKIPLLSKAINKNIEEAISIDKDNIRGYYVAGSYDFYTPEQFGGGKKVEEFLLKTIRLKEKNEIGYYLPTWGKEEAYALLIQFYIRKQKIEDARTLFHEAKSIFPNSYAINSIASMLATHK